jgi:hypothetical protein
LIVRLLTEAEIRRLPRLRLLAYRTQLRDYEDAKRAEVTSLDDEVLRLRDEAQRVWGDVGVDGAILFGGLVLSPVSGPGGVVMVGIGLYRLTNHTMKAAFGARDALQAAVARVKAVKRLLDEADWRLALIESLLP